MLNKHHDTASGVSAISRHGGFDRWALNDKHSKMVPLGSRLASGGIRGDGYTAYKGMSANNCESIDLLFNHAEVCTTVYLTWILDLTQRCYIGFLCPSRDSTRD